MALAVAKRLVVVAQRQGGQSQFSPFLIAPADPTSQIARIQQHVMDHLRERHTLESLGKLVGMSTRSPDTSCRPQTAPRTSSWSGQE